MKVWDIRSLKRTKMKEVSDMKHAKCVTSAFFSPAGNYLLTTCNDDRIRAYDTSNLFSGIPKGKACLIVCSIFILVFNHNQSLQEWFPQSVTEVP